MKLLWITALTLTLVSCVEPVIRRDKETEDPITAANYDKADLKKRIWVVPFVPAIAWDQSLGADPEIAAALQKQLKELFGDPKGPFILAAPYGQGLDDSQVTSANSDEELKRIAQGAGADGYLKGTIVNVEVLRTKLPDGLVKTNEFRVLLRVSFELYDAFSGRVLYRGQEEEKHLEQRSDLLRSEVKYPELDRRLEIMGKKLSQRVYNAVLPVSVRMGWTGRVLSVENARVYINAGEKTGLRMGDILKVIEQYKQISDYESGRLVGNVPGRIKGTVKIIQFFGDDGAIGVLQSGGGFSAGDMVQLY